MLSENVLCAIQIVDDLSSCLFGRGAREMIDGDIN